MNVAENLKNYKVGFLALEHCMLAVHTGRSKATINDGFALEQQNLAEMHINNDAGYHSTRTYLAAKKRQDFHIKKFEEICLQLARN